MSEFLRFFIVDFILRTVKVLEVSSQDKKINFNFTDILSVIVAIISAFVAILAYKSSVKISKTQMNVVRNQNEMTIYSILTSAKKDFASSLINQSDDDLAYKIFSEALLNAYNEACSKYFSGTINVKWFDLTYKSEIFNLTKDGLEIKEIYLKSIKNFSFLEKYFEKHKSYCQHKENQKT